MLLLITVMCVIAEKKLQLNSANLRCRNFYHWWYFNWGDPGPLAPPPPGYAYGLGNKRLTTSESKAARVFRVVGHCLQL